ncbi:hypothetical protein BV898_18414 [Hypsibius exemplaris]|uniref:Tr-type G domain-containing protein n=1 Tax=Hypsibius exemplaris TaxID=2072580 RepID=A0A9X6RNT0_HYPEX|nr:hypothetical protein BV898_18414 [Hypsibius exemplaris]
MEQRNMEMRALSSLARELRLTESAPAVLWNRGFRTVKKIQDSTPDQLRRLNLPKKDTDALILYSDSNQNRDPLRSLDRVHESPPTQPIPDTTSQPGGGTNVQLVGGQSHLGHETPRVVHHPSHDNCESIKDYNIFLIGETGAGKSTLVNYLVNGPNADLNNLKVAVPNRFYETTGNYMDHERNRADQTKSQTVGCTTYSFMGENACRYHVIDTPGLSDTRNDADPHQDDKNIDLILQAAEEAGNLSAIIVVINGTVPRFNASVKNAIERMRGNIPDALLQNIMILLTNCSRIGANFDVEVLPWRITENNVFAMNNAAFSHSPERLRDDERMMSELISHFANSKDTIRCLLARVRELSSVSTEVFRVIRENRDHIKSGVQSLLLGIRNILEVQGQLQLLTTDHQFALTSLQQFSAFKEKHYVEYYELKDSNSSGMFCGNHPNITCHKECKVWSKDPGSLLLILCEKMSMGRCTVCQCPYKAHHRAAKELIKSRKTLAAIVDAAKLGLPSVNEEKTAIKLATEMLEMDVAALRLAANAKHNEILDCIRKLKEVCSGYNFVAETKSVVGILENGRYGIRDAGILQDLDKYIGEINAMLNQYSFGDGIS